MTEAATVPDERVRTTEPWVCMGLRRTRNSGLVQYWMDPDGEQHSVDKGPLVKGARPGQVWNITSTAESIFTAGPSRPVYLRYEDSERTREWTVQSEAEETAYASEQRAKREGADATLRELLKPIRAQYQKTIRRGDRRALLAAVIDAVTWGE